MIDERDLYQEIEAELGGAGIVVAPQPQGRGFLAFALSLFSLSLLSLACVVAWIFLSEANVVPSVGVLLNGTATPTVTPSNTPTLLPSPTPTTIPATGTPAPTETALVAIVATNEAATPEPTLTLEPTAIPEPTATPLAWLPNIGASMGTAPSFTSVALEDIDADTPLQLMTFLGYRGEDYKDELRVVRAQTNGYLGDTSLSGSLKLEGALPEEPLFMFVGKMAQAATFTGQTAVMPLTVPYGETTLNVNLSSAILQQMENPSLVINAWQQESGWIVVIGRSLEIERAITACRNSLAARNPNYIMPISSDTNTCDPIAGMLNGSAQLDALVVLGLELDGVTLRNLLPVSPVTIQNRWIFADLGRTGAQLLTPDFIDDVLNNSTARTNYGIVRGTWVADALTLEVNAILDADTIDGLVVYDLHYLAR